MKKQIKYMLIATSFSIMAACTPSEYEYVNLDDISIDEISRVELMRSHSKLICDGNAQVELTPILYTKEGDKVLPTRVKDEWLEFSSSEGEVVSRNFSTSDKNIIGKTVSVTLKIKGKDIKSTPVNFEVIAPQGTIQEITIPVIFHIAQTSEDIDSYGGEYDKAKIYSAIDRMNNVFGGKVSRNAVGVDTKIKFVAAQYNQYGRKLVESGINRVIVKKINFDNNLEDFLLAEDMVWPADKFMNIWLISDRTNSVNNFGTDLSMLAKPTFINSGVTDIPDGFELTELEGKLPISASGLLYRLQMLNELSFSVGSNDSPGVNEMIHYVGIYLGLTNSFSYDAPLNSDYCSDTHDYVISENSDFFNLRWYNEALDCFFQLENIMDDPSGVHRSVSKDQNQRMRWVLENCPGRAAWKSNFALTGK